MKMSSRRSGLESGPIPQHCPQDVDSSPGEGDQRLGVLLALGSLAVVESSGLWGAAQAGKRRLVEDPLEKLVSSAHPVVVSLPLAGVVGCGDQSSIGGEPVGTLEGREVSCADQKLCPEDRTHTRQASEDRGLRTGEKTLPNLLVDALDAILEAEDLFGELAND